MECAQRLACGGEVLRQGSLPIEFQVGARDDEGRCVGRPWQPPRYRSGIDRTLVIACVVTAATLRECCRLGRECGPGGGGEHDGHNERETHIGMLAQDPPAACRSEATTGRRPSAGVVTISV